MKTGDTKTFPIQLNDLGINKNVNFIWIDGIGFVADRNIKNCVSYNTLEKYGYVTGKEITIDGERYNCRILKCTEWDDCMDYSDSDDVWHWENTFSWVRSLEFERAKDPSRAIRGYNASSCLDTYTASGTNADCGFRPVLEILNSDKTTINFEKWKSELSIENAINAIAIVCHPICPVNNICLGFCGEEHCKIMLERYFTEGQEKQEG